eukprot:8022862-Pyramimonas_sp.AAC.1
MTSDLDTGITPEGCNISPGAAVNQGSGDGPPQNAQGAAWDIINSSLPAASQMSDGVKGAAPRDVQEARHCVKRARGFFQ